MVSAFNRDEGGRHTFAAGLIRSLAERLIVPWPVYAETDLLLRSRGRPEAATRFGRSLIRGDLTLVSPGHEELGDALGLLERYSDLGIDLPDAVVMAIADRRKLPILTWDFRHFRAVVFRRGDTLPLLVNESELPGSQR